MMKFLKDLTRKLLFPFVKRLWKVSYSQAGEDVVIDFLFTQIGNRKPSFLDLGVYYPDQGNNTYMFYLRGARGVLVEADKTLIPQIRAKRPDDTILNIGVGITKESEADFYIFSEQGLNTFNKEEALKRNEGNYKIREVVKVPLVPIHEIIAANFKTYPDFLSIDIEGLDLEVLQTLDFEKYPIPVICAETCTYSENHIKPKDKHIENFLLSKGYMVYADTYINTLFVNKTWFEKK